MATIRKVDGRSKDYRLCQCCNLRLHLSQFWLGDQPCGACQREQCTKKICRLGQLHDR